MEVKEKASKNRHVSYKHRQKRLPRETSNMDSNKTTASWKQTQLEGDIGHIQNQKGI